VRIGILGGTFNPPHIAHLACASEAAAQLGLDRVLLIPVAQPPHKQLADDPGPQERMRLCELAIAGDERLAVCAIEIERGGQSYTVDTLRALHERAPENELTFIVGGDMALGLPTWREPQAVVDLARLAVAERPGASRQDILERLDGALQPAQKVVFLDTPTIDVSSSQIRRRVREGRPIRYLVPDRVADRIKEVGLYR
jgi:nicotinate-nucleotide adenylyltransferase